MRSARLDVGVRRCRGDRLATQARLQLRVGAADVLGDRVPAAAFIALEVDIPPVGGLWRFARLSYTRRSGFVCVVGRRGRGSRLARDGRCRLRRGACGCEEHAAKLTAQPSASVRSARQVTSRIPALNPAMATARISMASPVPAQPPDTIQVTMLLRRIAIENFRGIRVATLDLDPTTAIIGENGTGKSTFLDALSVSLSGHDDVVWLELRDFHQADNSSTAEALRIELVFQASEVDWQLPQWQRFKPFVHDVAARRPVPRGQGTRDAPPMR